jgi:hypothetical protein
MDEDKYGDAERRRVYREEMEGLGEDVVRHRLASRMQVSDRPENNPTPEFANMWLAEKQRARKSAENRRFWIVAVVTFISALAAVIAAAPVVRSWLG